MTKTLKTGQFATHERRLQSDKAVYMMFVSRDGIQEYPSSAWFHSSRNGVQA